MHIFHCPQAFGKFGDQILLFVAVPTDVVQLRLSRLLKDQFPFSISQCVGPGKDAVGILPFVLIAKDRDKAFPGTGNNLATFEFCRIGSSSQLKAGYYDIGDMRKTMREPPFLLNPAWSPSH